MQNRYYGEVAFHIAAKMRFCQPKNLSDADPQRNGTHLKRCQSIEGRSKTIDFLIPLEELILRWPNHVFTAISA